VLITTPNPYALWRTRAGQINLPWESVDHVTYLFPSGMAEMASRTGLLLRMYTTVDHREPKFLSSLRSPVLAMLQLKFRMRTADSGAHFGQRHVIVDEPSARFGWRYLTPLESLLHRTRRHLGQLGETSIYLLEKAD
jgi:hypothetical protein